MANFDLELAALLSNLAALWERAGQKMPLPLFPTIKLDEIDSKRLRLAERLAAGASEPDKGKQPQQLALRSIFDRVKLNSNTTIAAEHWLPAQVVNVEKPAYPDKQARAQRGDYVKLCQALEIEAKALRPMADQHRLAYLEGVYLLLGKYAAQVPASTALPDVSLFDLNHVSAAIVSCLKLLPDAEITRLAALSDKRLFEEVGEIAALLGGDISGVQGYIYGITDYDAAARALRGRSFYLQLLTDAAARATLRTLELPITSLIYGGGAHFFLLAPIGIAQERFTALQQDLGRMIFDAHGHELYLALGYTPVTIADVAPGKMSERWAALHGAFRVAKDRRYTEFMTLDSNEWLQYFAPTPYHEPDYSGDIELGGKLAYAQGVSYGIVPFGSSGDILARLGLRVAIAESGEALGDAEYVVQYSFSDTPAPKITLSGIPVVQGTRYTLNLVPKDSTFDTLAELPAWIDSDDDAHGIQRLSVLRMDVDNLGEVFRAGLGAHSTLARLATLSRTLATFFEGRTAQLCKAIQAQYRTVNASARDEVIYGVYAGGDDVFLVGPWHLMPDIAQLIRSEFSQLTGGHPDLTLSAGIAFVGKKYPLFRAADDAHKALDAAKGYKSPTGQTKDAIGLLSEVYPWQGDSSQRFEYVQKWAAAFIDAGKTYRRDFPMTLLGTLMSLEMTRRDERIANPTAKVGRYVWTGVYQLHRMREQYGKSAKNAAVADLIAKVQGELQIEHFSRLSALGFAARWAHLTLRRSSEA